MSYQVVEAVLDRGPADPKETLVLIAIAENANETGYAFPGVSKIAHRARCCERHAIRLIHKMATDGWLERLPKAAGPGKKQTAYQLNMLKLASAESHAAQIALEKSRSNERRRAKTESHAAQIALEKSHDILPQSQVTFHPVSDDILPIPILKNHEPSLEPSCPTPPPAGLPFGEAEPRTPGLVLVTPTSPPEKITDAAVESIRSLYPKKVAAKEARKAIAKQIGSLVKGTVVAADGRAIPKMGISDAVAFLQERTKRYANSALPEYDFIPLPATWYNNERYADDHSNVRAATRPALSPQIIYSDPEAMNAR